MHVTRIAGIGLLVLALEGCSGDRGRLPTAPPAPEEPAQAPVSVTWGGILTITEVSRGDRRGEDVNCVFQAFDQYRGQALSAGADVYLSDTDSNVVVHLYAREADLPTCGWEGARSAGQKPSLSATLQGCWGDWDPFEVSCPSGRYRISGISGELKGTFDGNLNHLDATQDLRLRAQAIGGDGKFDLSLRGEVKLTKM